MVFQLSIPGGIQCFFVSVGFFETINDIKMTRVLLIVIVGHMYAESKSIRQYQVMVLRSSTDNSMQSDSILHHAYETTQGQSSSLIMLNHIWLCSLTPYYIKPLFNQINPEMNSSNQLHSRNFPQCPTPGLATVQGTTGLRPGSVV